MLWIPIQRLDVVAHLEEAIADAEFPALRCAELVPAAFTGVAAKIVTTRAARSYLTRRATISCLSPAAEAAAIWLNS